MLLRELFEAEQTRTVGIIFGRFNPPHKGHRAAWEMASQNDDWFVGTHQSTQGPKDPLPYNVKIVAMKTVWPEIDGHIVAETSWLTLASKVYSQYGDVVLNVYTDEDWVTKTIVQYNGKEGPHGHYKFSSIQQQATPRLSSATALRTAVINGDRRAFSEAAGVDADTPIGKHSFFDVVAHYLLPYQSAATKPVAKKKTKQPVDDVAEDALGVLSKRQGRPSDRPHRGHEPIPQYNKVKEKTCEYCKRPESKCLCSQREDAAGVGTITSQNTTKDVNKGTLRKMMKGFKLI